MSPAEEFWTEMRGAVLCIEAGRPSGAMGYVINALRIANASRDRQRKACALRVMNWLRAAR